MRVLCEWMRGETNYIARPFGPVQKLLPACLPAYLRKARRRIRTWGLSQLSQLSQRTSGNRKWAIIKRKKISSPIIIMRNEDTTTHLQAAPPKLKHMDR